MADMVYCIEGGLRESAEGSELYSIQCSEDERKRSENGIESNGKDQHGAPRGPEMLGKKELVNCESEIMKNVWFFISIWKIPIDLDLDCANKNELKHKI